MGTLHWGGGGGLAKPGYIYIYIILYRYKYVVYTGLMIHRPIKCLHPPLSLDPEHCRPNGYESLGIFRHGPNLWKATKSLRHRR